MSAAAVTARAVGASILARVRDDLPEVYPQAPVWHPSTKAPRETGTPMTLRPPVEGERDAASARVVGRWLYAATHMPAMRSPFRWRHGRRAHYTGDGWNG